MDEIVRKAMQKWPNVPHCYGWLMLDARGAWRMRDEQAQAQGLPGDKLAHEALLAFINRNYACDDHGRWYFQNGPQRVYVNLEATPFIAHTDVDRGFRLHTGEPFNDIDAAWFTDSGQLLLQAGARLALLDDRDLVEILSSLRLDDAAIDDGRLLDWVAGSGTQRLTLLHGGQALEVGRIQSEAVTGQFDFVRQPLPDPA